MPKNENGPQFVDHFYSNSEFALTDAPPVDQREE
jgi:hypothetical protein